jgi:hypothetical protein
MDWLNSIGRTFFDFEARLEALPQLLGVGLLNTLIISVAAPAELFNNPRGERQQRFLSGVL